MKPLNVEQALSLLGDNRTLYQQLVTVFLDEADGRMDAIETSVENNDADGIYTAAHALKNSANYIGAEVLAKLLLDMERKSNSQASGEERSTSQDYQPLLNQIVESMDVVKKELDELA